MNKFKSNKHFNKVQKPVLILVVLIVAVVGAHYLIGAKAATPYVSSEAEAGQLVSPAQTVGNDTTASGGSYVRFGPAPSSGGSTGGGGGTGSSTAVLTQSGNQLLLNGQPYKYGGFDFYGLTNSCQGSDYTTAQMDTYFSGLPPHTLTRTWAFQTASDNLTNALNEAAKYNQLLILSLSDGNSYCSDLDGAVSGQGSGKTPAWYESGYKTNYIPWVQKTVAEYKNYPAVGMWEIQNEPDVKENVSASDVEGFMNAAAAAIKAADPNHLVESGVQDVYAWGGSCAPESSPNIDVESMHEYDYDYNNSKAIISPHTAGDLACSASFNKPLIVGETGISIVSGTARATAFQQKFNGYLGMTGISGVNIWDYSPQTGDQFEIQPGDPVIAMVDSYVAP